MLRCASVSRHVSFYENHRDPFSLSAIGGPLSRNDKSRHGSRVTGGPTSISVTFLFCGIPVEHIRICLVLRNDIEYSDKDLASGTA